MREREADERGGELHGTEWKSSEQGLAYLKFSGWKVGQLSSEPDFTDRNVFTVPVGSFRANIFVKCHPSDRQAAGCLR